LKGEKKVKLRTFAFVVMLAAGSIITVSAASAQEVKPRFEFEGRYWWPEITGSFKAVSADIGSGIDIKDDLGVEDEGIPEGKLTWYTGPKSSLRVSYYQVGYDGADLLERTIQFKGNTYAVGVNVESSLDVQNAKLGWAWQFINLAEDKIKLGTLLETSIYWGDYSVKRQDGLLEASQDFMAPVPAIGGAMNVTPWEWMDAYLDVSGLPLGSYGHTLNVEGGVKIIPMENVSVIGGYRYSDLDFEGDPEFLKMTLSGPFVGATLRF
jgi:hypothetical protein